MERGRFCGVAKPASTATACGIRGAVKNSFPGMRPKKTRRRNVIPAPRKKLRQSSGFALDGQLHRGRYIAEELDGDGKFADHLDGVVELDFALVDCVALRRESVRDVGGGHGAEELIV